MPQNELIENTEKIVVIGAGPAGLAMVASLLAQALDNRSKKFEIHFIEKRSSYERRQKIVSFPDSILKEEIKWGDFCKKIFYPHDSIEVNEKGILFRNGTLVHPPLHAREKLLRKILRQEKKGEIINFSLRSLELALKEHIESEKKINVTVSWHLESYVSSIHLKENRVGVKNKKIEEKEDYFKFDTLIICEGVKRETITQINEAIKKEELPINPFTFSDIGKDRYVETENTLYYPNHCAVRLIRKDNDLHQFNQADKKQAIAVLRKWGWLHTKYGPDFHMDDNSWKSEDPEWYLRVHFVGMITPNIKNIKDELERKEAILEWVKAQAALKYRVPMDCFELDTKGNKNLHVTLFTLTIQSVDSPIRILPSGSEIALIGDCAMASYHHTGRSSTIALNLAIQCANGLMQDESHYLKLIEIYHAYERYLEKFIQDEFHQNLDTHPNRNLFKHHYKNLKFIKDHVAIRKEYDLHSRMLKEDDALENDYQKLMKQIKLLWIKAQQNNAFAAYALAIQLENGVSYKKLENNYFIIATYKNLKESLFCWNLLLAMGYPVEEDIKRVKKQIVDEGISFSQRERSHLFFGIPIPDLSSLKKEYHANQEKYKLDWNASDENVVDINFIKEQIARLIPLAEKGDGVAVYALAKQLGEGVCYSKFRNPSHYIKLSLYSDFKESIKYWNILLKKGYPVVAEIKRIEEEQLTTFDAWQQKTETPPQSSKK